MLYLTPGHPAQVQVQYFCHCKKYDDTLRLTEMCLTLHRTLSHNAETKDFARPTSHPVQGWTGKNKAFCSPGTQNGCRVIKVYC